MGKELHTQDLGTIYYAEAYDLQLELHRQRVENKIPDTLLLLEHPHVFTLGVMPWKAMLFGIKMSLNRIMLRFVRLIVVAM